MSDQERHELIGKLYEDLASSRRDAELLSSELSRLGDNLIAVGEMLSKGAASDALYRLNSFGSGYDFAKLRARTSELLDLRKKVALLDEQLKRAGLPNS